MTAVGRYRTLLTTPGVPRVVLAGLVGRLPIGMSTLLFVLLVHAGTGSYAVAGYAAALNCAVVAVTGPPLGRLADRGHAALVLTATGLGQTGLLIALVLALRTGQSVPVILGLAAAAG